MEGRAAAWDEAFGALQSIIVWVKSATDATNERSLGYALAMIEANAEDVGKALTALHEDESEGKEGE